MNEKEVLHPQTDQLHVFISSRMQELEDLRASLHQKLLSLGIDAFVYEVELGARPDDPETVSLLQVERTDVFVLVIANLWEIRSANTIGHEIISRACFERLGDLYR